MLALEGLRLTEEIGRGTAGVVHRATDLRTGETVAVKLIADQSSHALLDLKREFRAARRIHHPNLVRLDEIVVSGNRAALCMEFIDGTSFTRVLQPDSGALDEGELRDVFRQLAGAIHALHQHGVLHADLKPSNVMRGVDGRVVVLDFGLSTLANTGRAHGGTPAYMAPERLLGGWVRPQTDWWSFGLMLFEATHGRDPFPERLAARLAAQKAGPPQVDSGVSDEFRALLSELLQPDADRRAGFETVVARLGGTLAGSRSSRFVGRDAELRRLSEIGAGLVHVRGEAGIGKSRLVEEWIAGGTAMALRGRCHPDERVPFNALDAVIDELVDEVPRVLPEYRVPACLAALFPVLTSLPVLDQEVITDPVEQRLLAFRELEVLLVDLARRVKLILWFDDVHWADNDACAALGHLLAGDLSRAATVVLSYRVGVPLALSQGAASPTPILELDLRELSDESAAELVEAWGGDAGARPVDVPRSPYALNRMLTSGTRSVTEQVGRLETVVGTAVEIIAVAGSIEMQLLDRMLSRPLSRTELRSLESEGLVRRDPSGALEAWHDRVRNELMDTVPEPRAIAWHGQLADTIAASASPDAAAIGHHLRSARRGPEARPWFVRAAEEAEAQLAFDRAAQHYQSAVAEHSDAELLERLGHARDRAGRSAEAASSWAEAAAASLPEHRRPLLLLSASRNLYAGRIVEGRSGIQEALEREGVTFPRWPLASALIRRAWLAVRGFNATRRTGASAARAETLLAATRGLVMVEPVLADALAVRAVSESLAVGSAEQVMEALGLEAVSEANVGGPMLRRNARRLLSRVEALANAQDGPFARGWVALIRGCVAFFETRFGEAVAECDVALGVFRDHCVGRWHETNVAMAFLVASLACAGEYRELAARLPMFRADARARGDAYSWVALHTAETYFVAIEDGSIDRYLVEADAALAAVPSETFTSPQYQHFFATTSLLLYQGEIDAAWERVERAWPAVRRAGFLQLEWLGGQLRHLRARVALRMARRSPAALRVARREAGRIVASRLPGLRGLGLLLRAGLVGGAERVELLARAAPELEASGMAGYRRAVAATRENLRDALTVLLAPMLEDASAG